MQKLLVEFPSNKALSEILNINKTTEPVSAIKNVYNYSNNKCKKRIRLLRDEYMLESTEKVSACIDIILNDGNLPVSYNEYYHLVENSCINGNFLTIYNNIHDSLVSYWETSFLPSILPRFTSGASIEVLLQCWNLWDLKIQKLKLIFMYLENSYSIYSKTKSSITEMGRKLFSDSLLKQNGDNTGTRLYEPNELKTRYTVFADFVDLLRSYLETEKNGDLIVKFLELIKKLDTDQSINFASLASDLVVKTCEKLDGNFSQDSEKWSKHYISESLDKISKVSKFLGVYSFKSKSYKDSVFFKMVKIMIVDRFDKISEKLIPYLILKDQKEVTLMYKEFIKWDLDLTPFIEAYCKIMQNLINEIMDHSTGDLISKLLDFKDESSNDCEVMFEGNELFDMKLRQAFTKCLNSLKYLKMIIEKLNKFIVEQIKDSNKEKLSTFSEIFKFISDKELFKETYSLQLSRRLIFNKTQLDLEKYAIELLSSVTGPELTQSLEIMVEDIIDSRKISGEFSAYEKLSFDFESLALNSIHWQGLRKKQEPNNVNFEIPQELQSTLSRFEQYWIDLPSNKNKSLKWFFNLNSITLVRSFKYGEKHIFANFLQGCILLLFNNFTSLTYTEIKDELQIPQEQILITTLKSLSRGKFKLLIPSSANSLTTSTFHINENFKSKTNIIRPSTAITTISSTTSATKNNNNNNTNTSHNGSNENQSVEQEDKLKALIMRILKREKQLKHKELVKKITEVYEVDILFLKPIIENLIYQEYIKRKLNEVYEYIP